MAAARRIRENQFSLTRDYGARDARSHERPQCQYPPFRFNEIE